MPTYRPAQYGIQLSEALAEAAASAPVERARHLCLELRHPLADPIRLTDNTDPLTVTHEAGAPLLPGAAAEYLPAPIAVGLPEESPDAGTPQILVTISHVNGAVAERLRATRDSLQPWLITERVYLSDDLTGPAVLPPLTLEVLEVEFGGEPVAVLRCAYGDPARRPVPRLTYRVSQYPGLTAR